MKKIIIKSEKKKSAKKKSAKKIINIKKKIRPKFKKKNKSNLKKSNKLGLKKHNKPKIKKNDKIKLRKNKKNKKNKIRNKKTVIKKKKNSLLKVIKFQSSLKPKFNIKINFSLEKYIQLFFDKIENIITEYKILNAENKRKIKLDEIEKKEKERILLQKKNLQDEELKTKFKEKALKEEIKLEKERTRDIKLFLRKEQALLRIEQAEKQKQFLRQLQLEKQIEKFRIREVKELEKLEKISLKEKREDYTELQARIEKLKDKYRVIRDQKIRERVEALGVQIHGDEDRETLLQKEKDYTIARQKIELSLESFYRSAGSLVFQLNNVM